MKTKISAFEFAIMEICDPDEAKKYEPYTQQEITEQKKEKFVEFVKQIKVKKSERTIKTNNPPKD